MVAGRPLGDLASRLSFEEPWEGLPVRDPTVAQGLLCLSERRGCDPAPIDLSTQEGTLTLLSYIWPDEPDRLARVTGAIEIARSHPAVVDTAGAVAWVERCLAEPHPGRLTVVWQSVMRQYLDETERHMLEARMEQAGSQATDESPLAWVTLEPGDDHLSNFTATCRSWPHETTVTLADCGAHGPPVVWRPTHRK